MRILYLFAYDWNREIADFERGKVPAHHRALAIQCPQQLLPVRGAHRGPGKGSCSGGARRQVGQSVPFAPAGAGPMWSAARERRCAVAARQRGSRRAPIQRRSRAALHRVVATGRAGQSRSGSSTRSRPTSSTPAGP